MVKKSGTIREKMRYRSFKCKKSPCFDEIYHKRIPIYNYFIISKGENREAEHRKVKKTHQEWWVFNIKAI
jgi:hypothetical protein